MGFDIVFQIIGAIITIVASFMIVKQKVTQHDEKFISMHEDLKDSFKSRDAKIEAIFRKLDQANDKIASMDKDLERKPTFKDVEEQFITRRELDLKLTLIENITTTTSKEVMKMEKQLENIYEILKSQSNRG